MRDIFSNFRLNLKIMSTFIILPSFEYLLAIKIFRYSDKKFGTVEKIYENTEIEEGDTLMLMVL